MKRHSASPHHSGGSRLPAVVDPNKDPGAEFTMLGWTVYGRRPVTESVTAEKQFLLTNGQEEFEKLCSLDVLGLKDTRSTKNRNVHEDFLQQLRKGASMKQGCRGKRIMYHFRITRTSQRLD